MEKNKTNKANRKVSGRHIFAVLIVVFVIAGGIAAYNLIMSERNYSSAQNEYADLRQYAPPAVSVSDNNENNDSNDPTTPEPAPEAETETTHDLTEINPDYIGWIRIDGTEIDYPIVHGVDNEKYLDMTFTGERNRSGTIFMDAECRNGFSFFSILHGHNMRDGSMFAGLKRFLDNDFRANHPEITIITYENNVLIYNIFAVKITNVSDSIFDLPIKGNDAVADYFEEFGFSAQNLQDDLDILVLATCSDGSRSDRLLVLAARNRH